MPKPGAKYPIPQPKKNAGVSSKGSTKAPAKKKASR